MKTIFFIFLLSLTLLIKASYLSDIQPGKVALIIAVGKYPDASGWDKLSSANDVRILTEALTAQGFEEKNIAVLMDENATRQGILDAIRTHLINKVKKGDAVIFHFSGHGQQMQDDDGDEVDGFDEAIVPYDSPLHFKKGVYEGENLIRDEELGALLKEVRQKISKNGHLLALIDACHSGTGLRAWATARGTKVRMASKEYIDTQADKVESNALAAEVPDVEGIAPMVAFFSASPKQSSYEHSHEGQNYGMLSYAFAKTFRNLKKEETYRTLFDQIRLEVSAVSGRQTPQSEGLLNEDVFGGEITGYPPYFTLSDFVNGRLVKLNGGTLAGLNKGSIVAFYKIGTRDTAGVAPKAIGVVAYATLLDCEVELLDCKLDEQAARKSWVFIREQNYGSLSAKVRLEAMPASLHEALQQVPKDVPAIQWVEDEPDLILMKAPHCDTALFLLSKDEIALDTFDIPTNGKFRLLLLQIRKSIIAFAQAKFLRPLEMEDAGLNAALEFRTPGGEPIRLEEKRRFRVGEQVRLRIHNTGTEPFYFCLIDIPPTNRLGVIIPLEKPAVDYYLLPGAHYEFESTINISKPVGTDVLKLIASEQPLDLSSIVRGEEEDGTHPLEVLLRETYLSGKKRGGETSNVSGGGVTVKSVVVEIWE